MIKIFLLALLVTLALTSPFHPLTTPILKYYEDRGKGLTNNEADFIKARILEAQKQDGRITENPFIIQPTLDTLGGQWGVFIGADLKTSSCQIGIAVGEPEQDKWIQMNGIGEYPEWEYAIWRMK